MTLARSALEDGGRRQPEDALRAGTPDLPPIGQGAFNAHPEGTVTNTTFDPSWNLPHDDLARERSRLDAIRSYLKANEGKYATGVLRDELAKAGYGAAEVNQLLGRPWTTLTLFGFAGLSLAGMIVIGLIFNWPEESGDRGLGIGFAVVGCVGWFLVLRYSFAKYRGVPDSGLADLTPYRMAWNALPFGMQRYAVHFLVAMATGTVLLLLSGKGL